jgi:hypothetical protein
MMAPPLFIIFIFQKCPLINWWGLWVATRTQTNADSSFADADQWTQAAAGLVPAAQGVLQRSEGAYSNDRFPPLAEARVHGS